MGYFVFAHDEVIDRLTKYAVPLILAAVVLGPVYLFLHFGDNYAVMPTVNCIPAVIYAWVACLAILAGMKRWGNVTSKWSKFIAERSFGLYVFHYLPISATALAFTRYVEIPVFLCYLLSLIAAFVGSYLLYEGISRIPVIRWCVLGQRYFNSLKDR